jgi:hypothetical protein
MTPRLGAWTRLHKYIYSTHVLRSLFLFPSLGNVLPTAALLPPCSRDPWARTVTYISKYVTKAEPKSLVNVKSSNDVTTHLLARRMGSMECMVLLLSFSILP